MTKHGSALKKGAPLNISLVECITHKEITILLRLGWQVPVTICLGVNPRIQPVIRLTLDMPLYLLKLGIKKVMYFAKMAHARAFFKVTGE